jgi:TonB family protein
MKLTCLFFLLIAVFPSVAQTGEKTVTYFDVNGQPLPHLMAQAYYYQTVEHTGKRYKVNFYRVSDRSLALEAECSTVLPKPLFDGPVKYYYVNGTLMESKSVRQYRTIGRRDLFYENGSPRIAMDYGVDGQARFVEARSRDGKDLIPKGNGIVPFDIPEEVSAWRLRRGDESASRELARHVVVRDYKETGVFDVYTKGDTLYRSGDQKVAYKGGDKQFHQDITTALYYPEAARRLKIEGVTWVKFIVRPNGRLDSVQVERGFDPAADREAVVAIKKIQGWIPGRHNDKAVSMREKAQIIFQLSKADRKAIIPEPFLDKVNYFDEGWRLISDSTHAAYTRRVESKAAYDIVRDYYRSGALRMESECSAYSPQPVQNGKTTFYYENGNRQMEGIFKDNTPVGTHRFFYANGKPERVVDYSSKTARLLHAFSEDGKDLLVDGATGGDRVVHNDSVYTVVEKQAEYMGGLQAMGAFIGKSLRYPALARKQGAAGTVFISFVIDRDGSHRDHTVVQGFHPDCDQEALRVISSMPPWIPATINGVAVTSRFVLPIKFKLER